MTHPPLVLLLLVPLLAGAQDRVPPPQTLLEESFEQGDELPHGWTVAYGTPANFAWTADAAHSGERGVRITEDSEQQAAGLRSAKLPVTPGQLLWARIWHKALKPGALSLYFEYWDADGTRLSDQVKSNGLHLIDDWTESRCSATVPDKATHLTLLVYCWSGGTCDACVDDLTVGTGFEPTHDRTPRPPAQVQHPCGPYSREDIERARRNVAAHPWAQSLLDGFKASSRFWMELPDDEIPQWIPELTPFRAVFCPNCRANWDYCWQSLGGDRLRCLKCGTEFPNDQFAETHTEVLLSPTGRLIAHPYYQDAKGHKYWLSGRSRYQRIVNLSRLGALGRVYALTGDRAYADKAVKVLRRLAEVYPDWVPHDWTHVYSDFGNTQSGRMSGWKLHDCSAMIEICQCYDLIYDSGALTEDDKVAIENRIFRELGEMLLPIPQRGCCINDGPYLMSCGAYLGVLLGDHRLVQWAVAPPGGFIGFLRSYYFRDGHWEDGSPSYEAMALSQLYVLPEILQGYSDPPSYTAADRYDQLDVLADPLVQKIHIAPLYAMFPNRRMPPINDSVQDAGYAVRHAEVQYHWYPTDRNRAILNWVRDGKTAETGDEYALFRRDPQATFGDEQVCLNATSLLQPGLGWAILRHGEGAARTDLVLDYGPHCSGHGHPDRLNLDLFANGREVVTDLGYLGARHDFTPWLHQSIAHNLVVVDGQNQQRKPGRLLLFATGQQVQAVVADAAAVYPQCRRYERTAVMVSRGSQAGYLVDVYRVDGGEQHDYAFHGDGAAFDCPALSNAQPVVGELGPQAGGWAWLKDARTAEAAGEIVADWRFGEQDQAAADVGARLRLLDTSGELIVAKGYNLRNRRTPFEEPVLDFLYQRRPGPQNTFVAVIEPVQGAPAIRTAHTLPLPTDAEGDGFRAVAVQVDHVGGTDLVISAPQAEWHTQVELAGRPVVLDGRLGVVSLDTEGKLVGLWLADGTRLSWGDQVLTAPGAYTGRLTAVDDGASAFTVDTRLPAGDALAGAVLLVGERVDGAYTVERVEAAEQGSRVILRDGAPLSAQPGEPFRLPTRVER